MKTIASISLISVSLFAAASAITFAQAAYVAPVSDAVAGFTSGPADAQVAAKYGRLDHSKLMAANALVAANPGPAAVAAYESQPQ